MSQSVDKLMFTAVIEAWTQLHVHSSLIAVSQWCLFWLLLLIPLISTFLSLLCLALF